MKKGKRILIAILTMLCVVAAVLGIVGCNGSCNGNGGGNNKYDGLYNAYVRALEDGEALSHDDWYATYKDAIDNANIGSNYTIDTAEAVTDNGVEYVEYLFTNGKIYRLTVEGSDFDEYVVFALAAKFDDGQEATNTYLDIYYENGEDRVVWRTIKLDEDGKFNLYVPVKDTKTYGVRVSATGNSNQVGGIPVGEEPTFNVESEKSVEITLYEPVEYRVVVEDVLGNPLAGAEVGIYYDDADNKSVIVRTVTGATGTLTAYFVVKEGSSYVIKLSALPPAYAAEEESYPLNFNVGITTIVLLKTGVTTDIDVAVPANIAQQAEGDIRYTPANVSLTTPAEPYRQGKDNYTLGSSGAQLFVQLTKVKAGVHTSKSILELITEDESYFNAVHLHIEEGQSEEDALIENVWDRYIYGKMLKAYADKVNSDGLYALTDELYEFIKDCASLFAGATGSEKDYLNALMYYNGPALALGADGSISVPVQPNLGPATRVQVKAGMPGGYYKLSVKRPGNASGVSYRITYDGTEFTIGYNKSSVTIYFKSNFSTFDITSDATGYIGVHSVQLTLELSSETGDYDLVKSIDKSGEYYLALYPKSIADGISYHGDTYNTKLPVRGYYTYTIDVLEAPEGVNVFGNFYVCDDDLPISVTWKRNISLEGSVTQRTYYSGLSANIQARPCFNLYYTVGEDYEGAEDAVLVVKVSFTLRLDKINITYSGGTGATGSMTGSNNVTVGTTYVLVGNAFTNGNLKFAGWLEPVSGNVYKEGESITLPSYDLNFVALWREPTVNAVDEKLGTSKPLTISIDTARYTSTIVNFDTDEVVAGRYTLKADFGTATFGNAVQVEIGGKALSMIISKEFSTEGHNVYILHFALTSDKVKVDGEDGETEVELLKETTVTFITASGSTTYNITLNLSAYTGSVLEVDDSGIEAVVNAYYSTGTTVINATTAFTFTFGESVQAGTKYRLFLQNYSGVTVLIYFYTGRGTATVSSTSISMNAGASGVTDYTAPADLEGIELYIRVYSNSSTYTVHAGKMLGVRLANSYSYSYDKNDNGESTGSVGGSASRAAGEIVSLPSNTSSYKLKRPDYEFMGYTIDPDFTEYNPDETYLQLGTTFEMPARDVVIKAVWRKLVYNQAQLGVGEEGKVTNFVLSSDYEGGRVFLKDEVKAGTYIITLELDHDLGSILNAGYPSIMYFYFNSPSTNNVYLDRDDTASSEGHYVYKAIMVVNEGEGRYFHFYQKPADETKVTLLLEEYDLKKIEIGKELEIFVHPYNAKAPYIVYYEIDESITLDYALTYYVDGKHIKEEDKFSFTIYTVNAQGVATAASSSYWTEDQNQQLTIPAGTKAIYFMGNSSSRYNSVAKIELRRTYIVMYKGGDDADALAEVGGSIASHTMLKSDSTITVRANGFTREGYEFIGFKIEGDATNKIYNFPESVTLQGKDIIFVAQWNKIDVGEQPPEPPEPPAPEKVEATLGKGEEAKGTLTVTEEKQAAFNLGESVTVDNYTLTIVSDTDLGTILKGKVGETDLYLIRTEGVKAVAEGDEGEDGDGEEEVVGYTYIGFPRVAATGSSIIFPTGIAATLTATLVTYTAPTVTKGGDAIIVPVNPNKGQWSNAPSTSFYFKHSAIATNSTFYFSVENLSDVDVKLWLTLRSGQLVNATASQVAANVSANSAYFGSKKIEDSADGGSTSNWSLHVNGATYPTVPVLFKLLNTVTVTYSGGQVEEGEDPITGSVSSATVAQGATHALKANSFKRTGYTFIGWQLGGIGQILDVGTNVTVNESQTYIAAWKKDLEDGQFMDGMLGFGSANNVTVRIDPTEKQSMTINIDLDELTTGTNYLITATLTADHGEYLMFTMEGGNINTGAALTYNIYLVKDETNKEDGKYVYFGYLYIHEQSAGLKMSYKDETFEAFNMTLQLDNYTEPELKADGETYYIPVTPDYDEIMKGEDRIFLDFNIPAGKYKLYYYDLTGGKLAGTVYAYANKGSSSGSSLFSLSITSGANGSNLDLTTKLEGVEDLDLRLYTKYIFSVIGVKFVRVYDVTYENGLTPEEIADGATVSGTTSAHTYLLTGEEITVKNNSFNRAGYIFLHWADKDGKRYDPNNTITVKNEDVVLKAVWRKIEINEEEGVLELDGEEMTITIDSTKYTLTQFGLSLDSSKIGTTTNGNFRLKLDFGANNPQTGWVLLYIPSSGLYLYMAKSDVDSTEGHNVYVGDFKPTTSTTYLQIITTEENVFGTYENVKVTLEEIDFTWKPGGEYLMAINGYHSSTSNNHVYYDADDCIIAGAYYKVTITAVNGMLLGESASIYAGSTSSNYTTSIAYGEELIVNSYYDGTSSYAYLRLSMTSSSAKYGTMVKVKIEWNIAD
ncbi:MAG: InlB B-repeat-containing protein [Clostridiales bacterium]|nr:InlB B-repeat-containing protein [Clostridiales bacterium]